MRRLPWILLALFVGLGIVGLVLSAFSGEHGDFVENLSFSAVFMVFAVVGALVASQRPHNPIGWLFLAIGCGAGIGFVTGQYAIYGIVVEPGSLPLAEWTAWVSSWSWLLFIGPAITFLPLLFPTGTLPSKRWRPFAWAVGILLVGGCVVFALAPDLELTSDRTVENPLGIDALEGAVAVFDSVGFLLLNAAAAASFVALVLRLRRARAAEREQIKWFVFGVGLIVGFFVLLAILEAVGPPEASDNWVTAVLAVVAFASLPVGAGIGMLRHRLFDVDLVINKTVLFGVLAAFITLVYVAIVVGIGAAVGSQGNVGLSILATAVIAVAFQPARERARRLADRLVYGKRATPYEVLSEFSERMGGTLATEDVLPRMAQILGEGTGATGSHVWLRVENGLRLEAAWIPDPTPGAQPPASIGLLDGRLPVIPRVSLAVDVSHQGELLGALSITKPPSEPVSAGEEKLVRDLASQAGLVLRNVRLTAELMVRLRELQASRQRIVRAQDEERRRLERNIHDGAQQQLVALGVKLGLAHSLVGRDPDKERELLSHLQREATDALENLRDLARGIYPPLLADQGLPVALEAQARRAALPVEVETDSVGRYPQEAEAAVYFCVLEALQNVAKYAGATRAGVRLWADDVHLAFVVSDDGRGFDPSTTPFGTGLQGMADRLEAVGGKLEVQSSPGRGTSVAGRVPIEEPGREDIEESPE